MSLPGVFETDSQNLICSNFSSLFQNSNCVGGPSQGRWDTSIYSIWCHKSWSKWSMNSTWRWGWWRSNNSYSQTHSETKLVKTMEVIVVKAFASVSAQHAWLRSWVCQEYLKLIRKIWSAATLARSSKTQIVLEGLRKAVGTPASIRSGATSLDQNDPWIPLTHSTLHGRAGRDAAQAKALTHPPGHWLATTEKRRTPKQPLLLSL